MIFGNPSTIAVRVELNREPGGSWLFGRFGLTVASREIWAFAEGTSLRDVLFQLEELDRYGGDRFSPSLSVLQGPDAFQQLNEVMFGEPDREQEDRSLEEQWARHRFLPAVDVLRGWKGFVLADGAGRERIVLSASPFVDVQETWLDRGEVDGVLREARRTLASWLDVHMARAMSECRHGS